jgi:WD and tetratricopeptide repeats protein 1
VYNEVIALSPQMAVLYANRAAAFMKRKWEGDDYAAYRDCSTALALDPSYSKAHFRYLFQSSPKNWFHLNQIFRMINCLIALHKPELAQRCLEQFAESFPEEAESPLYKNLAKDIESDAEMIKKMETGNSNLVK